jgi:hypothetical protein
MKVAVAGAGSGANGVMKGAVAEAAIGVAAGWAVGASSTTVGGAEAAAAWAGATASWWAHHPAGSDVVSGVGLAAAELGGASARCSGGYQR